MMEERKKRWIIIIALAAIIFCGSYYGYWQKSAVPDTVVRESASEPHRSVIENYPTVYVSGAVLNPGLYKLLPGSRVTEAVAAAGGLLPEADVNKVNMAKLIKDGMQVHVPIVVIKSKPLHESKSVTKHSGNNSPSVPDDESSSDGKPTEEGKTNINTAGKQELERLPGIGPALADRIIEYRATNGLFRDAADLKKVQGIGEAKFNQIKDKVTL